MLKVLIWQISDDTSFKDKAIKILEQQHNGIEIVGEAVTENIAKVDWGDYEVLLCVGAYKIGAEVETKVGGMNKVIKDAMQLQLDSSKLLNDRTVCIPGFTLEKYRQLQKSRLSIFSVHCFGGLLNKLLGLPQLSPFGTNGWNSNGFIRFLREPHRYLEEKLIYTGNVINAKGKSFPVGKLGDINLTMFHYKTFEDFVKMWERRKQRINWDNIFVETWTENLEYLKQFDSLPYVKKVCFVPFKSDLSSAWYINPDIDKTNGGMHDRANNFARGKYFYYDIFDMLLYGKKTPLIDIGYNYLISNPFY